MLAHSKGGANEPGRVIEVALIGYTVDIGGSSQISYGSNILFYKVLLSYLLVDAGVLGSAVKAEACSIHLLLYDLFFHKKSKPQTTPHGFIEPFYNFFIYYMTYMILIGRRS